MTTNFVIQYTLVGICLLAACVWIVVKVAKRNKRNSGDCCGCSLSDTCASRPLKKKAMQLRESEKLRKDSLRSSMDEECPHCKGEDMNNTD